jgi:DNA-binding response OmpR family regulator
LQILQRRPLACTASLWISENAVCGDAMSVLSTTQGRLRSVDDNVKVLLIEDDDAAAEMYRLRLTADGYTVAVADDGEKGLAMAVAEQPDFIYLDLRLPRIDGFEVLERLRADSQTSAIPVIILSNFGEPELRERGFKLGALEFLVKADTTPSRLSETVNRVTTPKALPSV